MIVGYRLPIPYMVARAIFEAEYPYLHQGLCTPDMESGVRDEAYIDVLAGWEIHREAVE